MHTNGSPLSVAQRPNSGTDPVMRSPSCKPEGLPPRSAVGFLLLDSSLRPVAFNAEAIRVLSYPNHLANVRPADAFLTEKIRESLLNREPARESLLVAEFRSGRRRYFCRTFFVDSDG